MHTCEYFNETTDGDSKFPIFKCIKCQTEWYKIPRVNNYEYQLIENELVKAPPVAYHLVKIQDYISILITFT